MCIFGVKTVNFTEMKSGTKSNQLGANISALKAYTSLLITSDIDGGTYELISFSESSQNSGDAQDVRRGPGLSAVFVTRDRVVVLDKTRQLVIKNLQNETKKKIAPPLSNVDNLFPTGVSGRIILKSDDRVMLYDQQANKVVNELL